MRAADSLRCRAIVASSLLLLSFALSTTTVAGPINTDVALTPRKGGGILRLQYSYREADAHGAVAHINESVAKATLLYGFESDIALLVSAPYVHRRTDRFAPQLGRFETLEEGMADTTVLAKYRFWQEDRGPGHTLRAAVLVGMNIRSGASDTSSDSYDPIASLVFTLREGRERMDADLVYQFNTGGGRFRHDSVRYDLSYAYRVTPVELASDEKFELDAVIELNGLYVTDGAHEVFLSPGLQLITRLVIFEASFQWPVVQEFPDDRPETEFRIVAGLRFQW